jgi:membrane protease YdiL (CAAX protease family)
MPHTRVSPGRALWVYVVVTLAVFAATRLQTTPLVGRYVHLLVAAIFLLSAVRLTRLAPSHYGVALGGLLEPAPDERPAGPLGIFDLSRAIVGALPVAVRELAAAIAVAAVVFPLYGAGYYWWAEPSSSFSLALPPALASLTLAQLVVVALPEEAFFRGYLQTVFADAESRRVRVLGVSLAPAACLLQAALFALVHFIVDPNPARLAVFFPALLFGWVRAWRGGIGASVALHAMSNLYSEILARSWL